MSCSFRPRSARLQERARMYIAQRLVNPGQRGYEIERLLSLTACSIVGTSRGGERESTSRTAAMQRDMTHARAESHNVNTGPSPHRLGVRFVTMIAILFALQVADGIDQVALSFTAPFLREALGLRLEALGAAFTAGYIGTALGAALFGTLADVLGRKLALCLSAIGFAMGSLTTIWVTTGAELVLVRFATGLALGGLLPIISAVVLQTVAPRVRATVLTLVLVGTPLGTAMCGPMVLFLEPTFGWQSIFILGSVAPAILAALAALCLPTSVGQRRRRPETRDAVPNRVASSMTNVSAIFQSDGRRLTLMLWLAAVASAIPMFFTLSWLPSLAREAPVSHANASIGPAIFSFSGLVAALILARLVDRFGIMVLVITTALGSLAFLGLGHSFGSGGVFLLACAIAGGLSISSSNLMGWAAGMVYEETLRASGVGWTVAIMRIGAAATPVVAGILIARGLHPATMFSVIAVFPLVSAYALFRLRRSILPE